MSLALLLMMPGMVAACPEWFCLEGPWPEAEGQGQVPPTPASFSASSAFVIRGAPATGKQKRRDGSESGGKAVSGSEDSNLGGLAVVIRKEDDNLNIEMARKSRLLISFCSSPLPSLGLPSSRQEGPLSLRRVLRWHQKLP